VYSIKTDLFGITKTYYTGGVTTGGAGSGSGAGVTGGAGSGMGAGVGV
ncbi:unnamed protein product, partial [marine sediment metagenome]